MINNDPIYITLDNVVGERTKAKYQGTFTLKKYLTNKEKLDASRLAEALARNIERSEVNLEFASIVAALSFHIVEAPKWWGDKGLDLYDREPVYVLSEELEKIINPPVEAKNDADAPESKPS